MAHVRGEQPREGLWDCFDCRPALGDVGSRYRFQDEEADEHDLPVRVIWMGALLRATQMVHVQIGDEGPLEIVFADWLVLAKTRGNVIGQ